MIPLTRPLIPDAAIEAVTRVLQSGQLVQGREVAALEDALAARCGRAHAIAVSSGTAALSLALEALAIDAAPIASIACPALTWPSPAHAALAAGVQVTLRDVDPDTWNARGSQSAESGDSTWAFAIDQFGSPLQREGFAEARVIEDAACAIGSAFEDGRPCGSFGVISCLSFHPRKLITTGEGGACLTDDAALAQRLRELRNHGQHGLSDRPSRFARAGLNFRMSEFQAALGRAQLPLLAQEIDARSEHARAIQAALGDLLTFQVHRGQTNYQTLGALLPEGLDREALIQACLTRGVQVGPLSYALPAIGTIPGAAPHSAPHAAAIASRGLTLPLFGAMTKGERDLVIDTLRRCVETALSIN